MAKLFAKAFSNFQIFEELPNTFWSHKQEEVFFSFANFLLLIPDVSLRSKNHKSLFSYSWAIFRLVLVMIQSDPTQAT